MKHKFLRSLSSLAMAVLFASALARAQCPTAPTPNYQTTAVSGTVLTFSNACSGPGTFFPTFEEKLAGTGSPAFSIVVNGCMRGGTCDVLETYTTGTNSNRAPSVSKLYDYFQVVPSWTGGTSVSVSVNYSMSPWARGPSSTGSGVGIYTVGTLPSGQPAGKLATVTDGSTASDCTVGGGTNKNTCIFNGTAWAFAGAASSQPSGALGQSTSNNNGSTGYAATSAFGLDSSVATGADAFAKAIATTGNTVSLRNFTGTQVVGNNNFNVNGAVYYMGPNTFQQTPGTTTTISANDVTWVLDDTTFDEQLPAYNSGSCTAGSPCYSPGTVTITNGSTAVTGVGTTWVTGYTGTHLVCGFVDYGTFTRTGNTTGTIASAPSTCPTGNYALVVPNTTFPLKVTGSNFRIKGTWNIIGDKFTAEGTLVGHTCIEVQASGFQSDAGKVLWCGRYGIDFLNASHTRARNLWAQGSASAGLNTNATSGNPTTDNYCDTCKFEDDNTSPTATTFGTYVVNIASTGGAGLNSGWHFPNITIENDVACTNGIMCDNTGNDNAGNSLYINSTGGQVGTQGAGTITTSNASASVTGNSTLFASAQNIVGAQIWETISNVPTLIGTVQSVNAASGAAALTLTGNATTTSATATYYFYTPLGPNSTGAYGAFQPLNGDDGWDVGPGKIRNFSAEGITPNGTNWNVHDMDISLVGVNQAGTPRNAGSGCISIYPGAATLGPGTIHHIRCGSSGYDLKIQLGGTVVVDGDIATDITMDDFVDYVDPKSNVPTVVGFAIANNTGTNCGSGSRKCQWTLQNFIAQNLDFRQATTQETYDSSGLTVTSGFMKVGPAGWLGTTIPAALAFRSDGGFESPSDGVHSGIISLVGNTTAQSFPANSIAILGPPSASFTKYALQFSAAGPSNATPIPSCGTPSSNISTCSFVAPPSSGLVALAKVASYTSVVGDFNTPTSLTFTCTVACVYTLPSAAPTTGGYVVVRNAAGFPLTVFPNGLTFNGKTNASFVVPPGGQALISTDGSNYQGGGSFRSMPRPADRPWAYYKNAQSTSTATASSDGIFINSIGTATTSAASSSEPTYLTFATATTIGTNNGYNAASNQQWFAGSNILYQTRVKLNQTTNIRFMSFLSNTGEAALIASDTPTNGSVGFRFSTAAGDTNWMACSAAAGSPTTCTSTGVAIGTAGVTLGFQMLDNLATPAIGFYVNGNLTNVITTNIPITAIGLENIQMVQDVTTNQADTFGMAYVYVESDKY